MRFYRDTFRVLGLAAMLIATVEARAEVAAGNVTAQEAAVGKPAESEGTKLSRISPWTNTTAKFLIPGTTGPTAVKSSFREVPAKQATFDMAEPGSKTQRLQFTMMAVEDPFSGKTYVMDGPPVLRGEHPLEFFHFYLSNGAQLKLYSVSDAIQWSGPYVTVPTGPGSVEQAIAQFEAEATPESIERYSMDSMKEYMAHPINFMAARLAYQNPKALYYFSDVAGPGNAIVFPHIEAAEMTDGILRVAMNNPMTKIEAVFWVDLAKKEIIKSVIDGEERDFAGGKPVVAAER